MGSISSKTLMRLRSGRFLEVLKPGGRLLITDYCTAEGPLSQGMRSYVQQRGYALLPVAAYAQALREAGFVDVVGEDRTQQVRAP